MTEEKRKKSKVEPQSRQEGDKLHPSGVMSEETQQKEGFSNPWFEMWNKFADAFTRPVFSQEHLSSFVPPWFKLYDDMAKRFSSIPLSGVFGEVYPKFVDAADIYMKLFKSWNDMAGNVPSSPETTKNILNIWIDCQKELFGKLFGFPVPGFGQDNISDMNEVIKKSMENFSQFYTQNYQPFIENWRKLSREFDEMVKGRSDPSRYKDFYSAFLRGYETTFGKFINMPMIGPSRQVLEKIHKSVDSFIKYCGAIVDFTFVLYSPGKESIEELSKKASSILKGEVSQEKYKEFYDVLIKTFEDRFHQLFKTPAFSQVLSTTLDAYMDFRKRHFEVIEESLKSTPIITRSELDDVHKEVYNLKKRIKELEKLLKNTSAKK
jgi:class III poly(R)-hydroxyalkanoic acid synthase PhaE subunit